jgi:hypothetical protein
MNTTMKTTLRRILAWDARTARNVPQDLRPAAYDPRLDPHAYSLSYALSRQPVRIH